MNFKGKAIIKDEASYPAVDLYIKKGQMPLCISLSSINQSVSMGKDVYADKFNGELKFERVGNIINVSANGHYVFEWGGPDDFDLPAKLAYDSVYDKDVKSHYFNAEEAEVDSGVVVEAPPAKAKK